MEEWVVGQFENLPVRCPLSVRSNSSTLGSHFGLFKVIHRSRSCPASVVVISHSSGGQWSRLFIRIPPTTAVEADVLENNYAGV